MAGLQCTNCDYRFTPKKKIPESCPYCNKKGTLMRAKEMQDWINEVVTEKGGGQF